VGFGIDLRARSRKGKGLFRRAPDPREITDRLGWLTRRLYKARNPSQVSFGFSGAEISVTVEEAELHVRGDTSAIGPGYHADVIARLAPLLDELDFVWVDAPPPLAQIQEEMTGWLARELGAGCTRWGVERPFIVDAAVVTPLGPRDAAWRDAVIAGGSPEDAFPWWDAGPGQAARARALVAMWHEVPWREPLDDAERDVMKSVDDDLRAARKANLAVPTGAWAELLGYLGVEEEGLEPGGPPVGYRRYPLEVELSGGWAVTLPGAFVGGWMDDGARYWATDGDRVVELTSMTANEDRSSDELLAVAPERHPVIERLSDGTRRGRAEAYDEGDMHVVIGLVTDAPHIAILTCKGGDDAWALGVWRTLRQRGLPIK
jgi:hypothetical protein